MINEIEEEGENFVHLIKNKFVRKKKSKHQENEQTKNEFPFIKPKEVKKSKKNSKNKKKKADDSEEKNVCILNVEEVDKKIKGKNKSKKNDKEKSIISNKSSNGKEIPIEDAPKTLLEIMNDTESGIPMQSSLIKKKVKKNKKNESENSEYSNDLSNMSENQSAIVVDKHFLRSKTERNEPETTKKENYGKYFKPKLSWDPITGKMIIEKPRIEEASQKMNEEIVKNNVPIFDYNGEKIRITSSSFKKNLHTNKWDDEETKLFYKALECFGTDFSLLEIVLTPRSREQVKNKFRKEEKENPLKVESALKKFDPKKVAKIIAVYRKFKEESKQKETKKVAYKLGRKSSHKKEKEESTKKDSTEFRKIFETIDTNDEDNDTNAELEKILNEISESSDEDKESDKTVSIGNDENMENEEGKDNHFESSILPRKGLILPDKKLNINLNVPKKTKVQVIIPEPNKELPVKIVEGDANKDITNSENNILGYEFLKNFTK